MHIEPSRKIGTRVFALAALLTLLVVPTRAEVVLLNAESGKDLSTWKSNDRKDRLTSETRFATRGNCSLQFTVAGHAPGVDDRECVLSMKPEVTDWRGYESLVLDIFNPEDAPTRMRVQIETSTDDARRNVLMPPGRWLRMVIPVAQMDPELADISRVRELRFVVDRTARDIVLHFDNVALLSRGESPPVLPSAFRDEVMGQMKPRIAHEEKAYSQFRSAIVSKRSAQVADWAAERALSELRNIRSLLENPRTASDVLAGLGERFDRATRSLKRVSSIVGFAQACDRAGTSRNQDILVGQGSSMTKLLPREMPLELAPAKEVKLDAARNETESFQLAVMPLRDRLRGVRVRCGDLRSKDGHRLANQRITCDVVGYVETKDLPPYETPLVGWWPDPILDWLSPVDVARGDVQSFWIRVRVPKDQAPGIYWGEVVVSGRGLREVRIPLCVRVRSFSVPSWSPMPTAITFGSPVAPYSPMLEALAVTPQWNAKLKFKWADMLADYYVSYDHLYRNAPPDFDVIDHLQAQGRLGAFNLGYFGVGKTSDGHAHPDELNAMLSWAKEGYRKAKERSLLGHAYIYGFDEVKEDWFNTVEETAAALKAAMPGVTVLTTAYDDTFGRDTNMPSIDGWTPKTSHYDLDLANAARKRGDQVWWYICVAPNPPYANIFLECPAIDIRLLMGAMTAKYRPDGFLYYQTSLWKATEPIRTGPFTNWSPVSYRSSHGDGSWVCMREGGLPVPTMRLENYRDGLEDYAYARILEEAVRIKEARKGPLTTAERRWLDRAKAALIVPKSLVTSLTEYSRDPSVLEAWRKELASLIESSGERDVDPWRDGFSLRKVEGDRG